MEKRNLLPFSLLNNSIENYYCKITVRSRIIYWIIICSVILTIAVLPFVYVDVSILARGFFQADIEKQMVYAPFSGKVIFSVIQNGKKIQKGDTLFIIDSEYLKEQMKFLNCKILENNASISDLKKLVRIDTIMKGYSSGDFKTPRYVSEYASFTKRYFIQFQKLRKIKTDHERNVILHKQMLIPDSDFENSQYNFLAENENLNQILIHQKTIWQTDLTQRRNDSVGMMAEYSQIGEDLKNRIVLAPVTGEIIQSSEIQKGSFVAFNQLIAEISPEGELIATCLIRPSDIGLVYENQPVTIQVDAFKYNEWGTLKGHISDISDDMITDGSTKAYFRVKCALENKSLCLKNGYTAEMKKGMSITGRFEVIRRSLFNLLFDKADKWFNPYMNKLTNYTDADKS